MFPIMPVKRGVTLVELLVVMVIMMVVMGAAFTLFQVTATHEARQQEVLTQTQNQRAALYTVARDVRMAGSGLGLVGVDMVQIYVPAEAFDPRIQEAAGWFKYKGAKNYGVRPIYGANSDTDDKSDTLTIFRTDAEAPKPLGQLKAQFAPADGELKLTATNPTLCKGGENSEAKVEPGCTINNGDILAVANGTTAVIVQAKVAPPTDVWEAPGLSGGKTIKIKLGTPTDTIAIGDRFKPGDNLPSGESFPPGSTVYNLGDITFVTYQVEVTEQENNKRPPVVRLMANYHDRAGGVVPVAHDIEDFQVAYYYSAPSQTDLTGPLNADDANFSKIFESADKDELQIVRAVDLAVVARTPNKSSLDKNGRPVEVMGHTANVNPYADQPDGLARRVLTETVQLRNYGPE
ncbi:MAG: PilW family protein [Candidatus Adiutrix sp.]|nr:PilW family protein [Candidatus Adiutrix sp.]